METLLVPSQAVSAIPGKRVLVIAPHPDDEVFGCGGAILRHVEQGATVHVRIWTTGGYGTLPGKKAEYVAMRQRESKAAAQVLGYGVPEFGSAEDRGMQYSEKLVHELLALIAQCDADLVYAPSVLEMHPDHRALGMAAVEAVRRRGDAELRLAQYEIGVPLRPNLLLDITPVAARKCEAMQCFASQLEKQRYDLDVAALNRYRSWSLPPEVTAAEAYVVATGEELQKDPLGVYASEHERQGKLGLALDSRDLPLVSVMVRSMDRPSLALALDSVALQTWQNIEVVVVNATGRAHRPLGDWCGRFPLRLVEPGRALERSSAANVGLDAARGDFCIFLDDDDLFLPHHIALLHAELKDDEIAVAAYADVIGTDRSGAEIRRFGGPFDSTRLRIENFIPIHALLFRRAAVVSGARFDEALPVCEDWDFWLQLLERGPFRAVQEAGAVYNMQSAHGSGVWVNQDETRRVVIQLFRKWVTRWDNAALLALVGYARSRFEMDELWDKLAKQEQKAGDQIAALENFIAEKDEVIKFKDHTIGLRNDHIVALKEWVEEQDLYITKLNESLHDQIAAVAVRDARIAAIFSSVSWRVMGPFRRAMRLLRGGPDLAVIKPPPPLVEERPENPSTQVAMPLVAMPAAAHDKHNYDYVVDPDSKSAPVFVCELVGTGKRVLEIGCGPGSITRLMKKGGNRVTGLEVDAAAIELARPHCDEIHMQDLNADNWPEVLGAAEPFDVVVAADVLEHLYDPWRTLRQMAALIHREGSIVVSLPHAGHAALAACLVGEDVAYGDLGLLDRTHIRFFGMKNIEALFAQAHLKIVEVRFVILTPEETELAAQWNQVSEFVRAALRLGRHANVYQVVVKAVSLGQPGKPVSLLNPG